MPFLLLVAGIVLVVSGIRGSTGALAAQLKQDVSGQFLAWLAAIVVIGALGFVPQFERPSRLLLALVILVVMLKNGTGFFDQFTQQIQNIPAAAPIQPAGGNAQLPAVPVDIVAGAGAGAAGTLNGINSAVQSAGKSFGDATGLSAIGGLFGF